MADGEAVASTMPAWVNVPGTVSLSSALKANAEFRTAAKSAAPTAPRAGKWGWRKQAAPTVVPPAAVPATASYM